MEAIFPILRSIHSESDNCHFFIIDSLLIRKLENILVARKRDGTLHHLEFLCKWVDRRNLNWNLNWFCCLLQMDDSNFILFYCFRRSIVCSEDSEEITKGLNKNVRKKSCCRYNMANQV